MTYITGETIKKLREKKKLTQRELAEKLIVSDKTISKWETNKGLPDISILSELADALSVSVLELLSGDIAKNSNISANMKKSKFYVCPVCSNVIHSMGEGAFTCCGIRLPVLGAETPDAEHKICIQYIENELFVHLDHPMNKGHYISFIALITDSHIQMGKLYPEQTPEIRFRRAGHGKILVFCNRHGLFSETV
ncbi:helix-turn-helix domain-containing protein [Caproiciproducens faecalis]|uniref:Helix-turn-helix domain-containing protein n=1 Tax=Caproiciproducens faecalis TaxID=2820301 RepID=A0ABS7DLA7_9FIRM|nr:helix-turn-helix domain-containing protein [Caproiciproducens faecalis]MBW7571896.1 helix-turn-helix domain-containing protein [Caproiciproducens faecalis]